MKRFVTVTGAAIVLLCTISAVSAEPRDSVDRGSSLDRDAIRDDVRINRLKIPEHPLAVGQPPLPQQPSSSWKGKTKSKRSGNIR